MLIIFISHLKYLFEQNNKINPIELSGFKSLVYPKLMEVTVTKLQ